MINITPLLNRRTNVQNFRGLPQDNAQGAAQNTQKNSQISTQNNQNDKILDNQSKDNNYKDPLMNWPVRGLAYSNELGAAISEVAPKLGTILWFPAMLYFGADIYDKYKNDQTAFHPDKKRGTEQAIFQLLASVILPTGAVIGGQKIASALGRFRNNGLTLQNEEDLCNFTTGFMDCRSLKKYSNDIDGYKAEYKESLDYLMNKRIRKQKATHSIMPKIRDFAFKLIHPELKNKTIKDLIYEHTDNNIDEMFKIRESLLKKQMPDEFSPKLFTKYRRERIKLSKIPEYKNDYTEVAIERILKEHQHSKVFKTKLMKTLGGFVALGLAIKPIDSFVEHVVMENFVDKKLMHKDKQA